MMDLWNAHGTKILGVLVTILGILVGLDATQATDLFGEGAQSIMTMLGGALTILRGFVNTANIKATVSS